MDTVCGMTDTGDSGSGWGAGGRAVRDAKLLMGIIYIIQMVDTLNAQISPLHNILP